MKIKFNPILSVITLISLSCSNDKKNKPAIIENTIIQPQKVSTSELKKFKSVKEMLEDAHDFTLEQGTLNFINSDENNLHIQISKPIVEGDSDKIIDENIKRDIIYVAFQVFAQTSTKNITITSIPIDFKDQTKYYTQYQKTVKVTRDKTEQIMQKEFGSADYSILFDNLNGIQIPNKNFNKLKFQDLDFVYIQLLK
ncbi:hypothetical protein [Chryseobacterium sp. SIMBA_028]|uniref:hypothetical protein n=1 Tax=Chryseobacterium sp. SIMBA_028 TaxID=3085771 RepID=UPI00397D5EC6